MLVVLLCQAGLRLGQGMTAPLLLDRGLDLALVGAIAGIGGSAVSIATTAAAAVAVRRWGAQRLLQPMLLLQCLLFTGFLVAAIVPAVPWPVLASLMLAKAVVASATFVVLYAAMMDWSSLRQPGVDFSLLQCADAGMAALAGSAGGLVAEHLGYQACFGIAAGLAFVAALQVPALVRRAGAESVR
jgi:MFS transporter (putative signal transducer)